VRFKICVGQSNHCGVEAKQRATSTSATLCVYDLREGGTRGLTGYRQRAPYSWIQTRLQNQSAITGYLYQSHFASSWYSFLVRCYVGCVWIVCPPAPQRAETKEGAWNGGLKYVYYSILFQLYISIPGIENYCVFNEIY
jgi:hypothetical protein